MQAVHTKNKRDNHDKQHDFEDAHKIVQVVKKNILISKCLAQILFPRQIKMHTDFYNFLANFKEHLKKKSIKYLITIKSS